MRLGRLSSFAMLTLGALLLAWAALQGDVTVHLLLFIPVVQGTGPAAALGGLLMLAGVLTWFLTHLRTFDTHHAPTAPKDPPEGERRTQSGGLLLIGPIPIAWGSDRTTLLALILAAIALMATAAVLLWLWNT